MSLTWRRVYFDGAVNPETGGECLVEVQAERGTHDGPHCHDEWENGEIVGPIYWEES